MRGCANEKCLGSNDDWDVYYERGRKPKESIIKYEATRSEGDYPEEGAGAYFLY